MQRGFVGLSARRAGVAAMKTTIEIDEPIYRRMKARAALRGQTMRAFVAEALADKLAAESARGTAGWRSVFGQAPPGTTDAVQAAIDGEFSRIETESWR